MKMRALSALIRDRHDDGAELKRERGRCGGGESVAPKERDLDPFARTLIDKKANGSALAQERECPPHAGCAFGNLLFHAIACAHSFHPTADIGIVRRPY